MKYCNLIDVPTTKSIVTYLLTYLAKIVTVKQKWRLFIYFLFQLFSYTLFISEDILLSYFYYAFCHFRLFH